MTRYLMWLLGIGLICASSALRAQNVTIITEFSDKNAPAYDRQMAHWQLLLQAQQELKVDYVHVGLQRGFELLDQSGYCTVNKLKTPERAQRWLFSAKPITVSPSLRLITLKPTGPAEAPHAEQAGLINLADWLRQPARPKIGIAAGRTYGADIDQLIKARPTQFYPIHGQDVSLKLWQMLKRGRVEAILDFPARIDYLRAVGKEQTAYAALPIQGQPLHLEGYIFCNRQAHGQALMRYFDDLMAKPEIQQSLLNSYRQYFSAGEWQQMQPYLHQMFPAAH